MLKEKLGVKSDKDLPMVDYRILKWVTQDEDELKETTKGRVQAVILDMTNLMNVDTSGILALEELHKRLLSRGVEVRLL
ncbi:low affinity sulfate transporter 3-like [Cajanus cajan]|uniref:low affinity sulfate transporter 3-like n=1 Tax=Cajanus cajan TaxID=3821 RepID=UPI0010FBB0C4|nr:low affinity sulfate transporter 3-like [Cajanus cajan]XP_029128450.1 low affinity sulfate transporter 3-like [Cajanus cajan]